MTASPLKNAKQFAQSSYNKLAPQTLEPFRVVSKTPYTLSIDENKVHNTVTLDRAFTAPNLSQVNGITQLKTTEETLASNIQKSACSHPQSSKE